MAAASAPPPELVAELELLGGMFTPAELVLPPTDAALPLDVTFICRPDAALDEDWRVLCSVRLHLPLGYPAVAAVVTIPLCRGLGQHALAQTSQEANAVAVAAAAVGEPSLYALISSVKSALDRSSGAAECAVCMAPMEAADSALCLPACLHSFHRHCLFTWWAGRLADHDSSEEEALRRGGLRASKQTVRVNADTASLQVTSLLARERSLQSELLASRSQLEECSARRTALVERGGNKKAGSSSAGTGGQSSGRHKPNVQVAAVGGGGSDVSGGAPAESLEELTATVRDMDRHCSALAASLRSLRDVDIPAALGRARAASARLLEATTEGDAGGAAGDGPGTIIQGAAVVLLRCPTCRAELLPSPTWRASGKADVLGRPAALVLEQAHALLRAMSSWRAAPGAPTAADAGEAAHSASHSPRLPPPWDPAVERYVRDVQRRHADVLARQQACGGLIVAAKEAS